MCTSGVVNPIYLDICAFSVSLEISDRADLPGGWNMNDTRILIVEDDFVSRNLLTRLVQGFGSVDCAVDGQEAVDAFTGTFAAGKPYDLVLLDIMMPSKDGQTVLKEIREYESLKGVIPPDGCKVVMITALSDAKNVMAAFRNQCEGYITKPYEAEILKKQLETLGFKKS